MKDRGAERRVPSLAGMTEEVALAPDWRNGFDGTGHTEDSFTRENKYRTHLQSWQDIFCFFSRGRRDAGTQPCREATRREGGARNGRPRLGFEAQERDDQRNPL